MIPDRICWQHVPPIFSIFHAISFVNFIMIHATSRDIPPIDRCGDEAREERLDQNYRAIYNNSTRRMSNMPIRVSLNSRNYAVMAFLSFPVAS
jgi:hypothetical protein